MKLNVLLITVLALTSINAMAVDKNSSDEQLNPQFRPDETFRGDKEAKITVVAYSDFECPFCARSFLFNIQQLLKDYPASVRYLHKHLPLTFHKNALVSAKYYEAVRLQGDDLVFKFHDEVLNNQVVLSEKGESYLKKLVSEIGVDMAKLEIDLKSAKILERIEEDKQEALKFEINGTPTYVINGKKIVGSQPYEKFVELIELAK